MLILAELQKSDKTVLAKIIDCSLNESTRHKLVAHRQPIFPIKYFNEQLNIYDMNYFMEYDL